MTDPLFRHEVLASRQSRWLGGIVLGQPVGPWLLTGLAVLAAAAIVAFLAWGEYTRRTRVTGQLVPSLGMASVIAPGVGTLAQVRVQEGQRVLAGDVLAVVATPRSTLAGGDTAQALQAAIAQRQDSVVHSYASQREQLKAQRDGFGARIGAALAEQRQVQVQLATRRRQQALAEQMLARLAGLREKKYITDLQLQQQQTLALDQLGEVQALERQALALAGQRHELEQARSELPARLAALDAAEQRDRASLSQESVEASSRAEAVIRSPVSGTVSTLLGQAGQAVQAGQPVLSLLPAASALEAHLLVPSRAVGFVEPGDAVLLRYQAFPYQKFGHHGGRVLRISRSALSAGELGSLVGNGNGGEPHYRIVVALDRPTVRAFGREESLKPGMLLEADILGERRRLWEWAIEPLFALSGFVAPAP
ncbi:MAG: HlyD family efflux transporter periplasmic adaptor subunit [Arenimonas sp.]|nr:HlyD family efflux transporter periplasmic adaptor subunit [Arenimonas sp.]